MISTPLLTGKLIRLLPLDPERDAEAMARWTHTPDYQWQVDDAPACPLSPAQVKKQLEGMVKEAETEHQAFHFAIYTLDGERVLGTTSFEYIQWTHAAAQLVIGFGDPACWENGAAADALQLLSHYAFAELNLYRLEVKTAETNARCIAALQQAGFSVEVRNRQAIYRDGKRCDLLHLGLLSDEWGQRMSTNQALSTAHNE
jgi:RimJ/RimL family protein N-acetyltransferase